LAPAQLKDIEARASKLGKLLDGKEEREAHVILGSLRGRHTAEITVNYHSRPLVGAASNQDLSTAIHSAIEKLEKQAIKVRAKWRDGKRAPRDLPVAEPAAVDTPRRNGRPNLNRADNNQRHKPLTLDEALLKMEVEKDRDYLSYRDAVSDRLSILVRRRNGDLDLVEC
jgi:putative sigma-54 modulation protein